MDINTDGTFIFENLQLGNYILKIDGNGYDTEQS